MGAVSPRQLAFVLDHAESFAREDFIADASNKTALALIDRWPDWPSRSVAIVGPQGSGKSHLASIWAEQSGARFLSARSLDEADLPASLATGSLVVEDVSPDDIDERSLFHLLNLAREEEGYLLLTMRAAPVLWPLSIRDLMSRLRALPIVTLAAPDDDMLRAVIVKLAADRQLQVDAALVNYIVTRIERSFAAARDAVARLDEEAMRLHRPVNRALASEILRDASG